MSKLSVVERRDLQRLETQIENGMQTFLQVGLALKEIRDLKLYREGHQTFEKYVSSRWEHGRQWAYQLIDAVTVDQQITNENVSHGLQKPTSQKQYRELAKLEPAKIPEVWEAVAKDCEETGEAPSAKKIKQFAAEIVEPEYEIVEVEESEVRPDDVDCGPVEPEWMKSTELDEFRKQLSTLVRAAKGIQEKPGTEKFAQNRKRILLDLGNAKSTLLSCIPHKTCPYCCGLCNDCDGCNDRGWVDEMTFKNAPQELKDAVEGLSSGGNR